MGFPGGSDGKESAHSAGDLGLIPGLGRSPAEGNGYPLQYSDLENSMDYSHGVAKSQTGLQGLSTQAHSSSHIQVLTSMKTIKQGKQTESTTVEKRNKRRGQVGGLII